MPNLTPFFSSAAFNSPVISRFGPVIPAFQASVTLLVPEDKRDRANAIQQMSGPASGIVAPVLAGGVYALVGLSGAILIDLLTTYGTQIFEPISNTHVAWNVLFIIDPLFTLPLLAGVVLTARKKTQLYVRLAQAHINLENWRDAADAVREALRLGGLKRDDQANIMLGMALFNQKRLEQARRAFEVAQRDNRSRRTAEQWIAYVDSEIKRRDLLQQELPDAQPRERDELLDVIESQQ